MVSIFSCNPRQQSVFPKLFLSFCMFNNLILSLCFFILWFYYCYCCLLCVFDICLSFCTSFAPIFPLNCHCLVWIVGLKMYGFTHCSIVKSVTVMYLKKMGLVFIVLEIIRLGFNLLLRKVRHFQTSGLKPYCTVVFCTTQTEQITSSSADRMVHRSILWPCVY